MRSLISWYAGPHANTLLRLCLSKLLFALDLMATPQTPAALNQAHTQCQCRDEGREAQRSGCNSTHHICCTSTTVCCQAQERADSAFHTAAAELQQVMSLGWHHRQAFCLSVSNPQLLLLCTGIRVSICQPSTAVSHAMSTRPHCHRGCEVAVTGKPPPHASRVRVAPCAGPQRLVYFSGRPVQLCGSLKCRAGLWWPGDQG